MSEHSSQLTPAVAMDALQAHLVDSHQVCVLVSTQVGDVVVGTVQSVKPYGAFVDIGGVNGLLHISQISEDRVTNVEAVLSEGDKLKASSMMRQKNFIFCPPDAGSDVARGMPLKPPACSMATGQVNVAVHGT